MGDRGLLYFALYRPPSAGKSAFQLCTDASNLSLKESLFVPPYFAAFMEGLIKDIRPGERKSEALEKKADLSHMPDAVMHAFYHPEGIVAYLLSDKKYDMVASQMVMNKAIDKFMEDHPRSEWSTGNKTFSAPKIDGQAICVGFKDPSKVNKLASIQKDLDETMETLRKAIQQTTLRGEQLDAMVEKSENLNASSKMFYQQAKKQNSCCVLM
ncbi:hypothetical protein NLU13_0628 [Sarocladium strictum]|uniref:Uncharacterized protein n=1 Tax=Sarocladium strictum TaxID=5046 RepID=A0AA39LAZ4_SARSR|nr:hypothetical protein NLU13_0628 [Sarocladium strictum]